jgi:hypothetical protein
MAAEIVRSTKQAEIYAGTKEGDFGSSDWEEKAESLRCIDGQEVISRTPCCNLCWPQTAPCN